MYSQNVINFNDKSYPSTDAFYFTQNASTHNYTSSVKYYEPITLSVGKKNDGGIVLLQKNNLLYPESYLSSPPHRGFENYLKNEAYLKGDLYLYLENGSIIHCIDRKIYGYIDDTSSALYYLTTSEVEKLEKSTITKIAYSLEAGIGETKRYSASAENKDTTKAIQQVFH